MSEEQATYNVEINKAYLNEVRYLNGLKQLFVKGSIRTDRTGTGTTSIFGHQERYDISNNVIPLLSTKYVHFPAIVHELIWMLRGDKSIKYLKDNNVNIWDSWLVPDTEVRDAEGKLTDGITSSIYGESWREWEDTRVLTLNQLGDIPEVDIEGQEQEQYDILHQVNGNVIVTRYIDQIKRVVWQLKNKPDSRRIILNGWNVARTNDVTLPPCHVLAQFYVQDGKLSCQLYQRSSDSFLGQPFNIVQYSLLTMLLAKVCGLEPDELIFTCGDMHIYSNHLSAVEEQLSRDVLDDNNPRIELNINEGDDITQITADQITLTGYVYQPAIKAPVAV